MEREWRGTAYCQCDRPRHRRAAWPSGRWRRDPVARRVKHVIPLGEPQSAEQVARATAFLCSEAADYMTGSTLLVDGGCSLFQFDE